MATRQDTIIVTRTTDADLSSSPWCIVKADGGDAVLAADGDSPYMGVLTDNVRDGSSTQAIVSVQKGGIGKVKVGAAITAPVFLMSDANGEAIPATTGKYHFGFVDEDAADGDIVEFTFAFGQLD
jgi:hypothetical protein